MELGISGPLVNSKSHVRPECFHPSPPPTELTGVGCGKSSSSHFLHSKHKSKSVSSRSVNPSWHLLHSKNSSFHHSYFLDTLNQAQWWALYNKGYYTEGGYLCARHFMLWSLFLSITHQILKTYYEKKECKTSYCYIFIFITLKIVIFQVYWVR